MALGQRTDLLHYHNVIEQLGQRISDTPAHLLR